MLNIVTIRSVEKCENVSKQEKKIFQPTENSLNSLYKKKQKTLNSLKFHEIDSKKSTECTEKSSQF